MPGLCMGHPAERDHGVLPVPAVHQKGRRQRWR
nr:MAG TPA: hypothetical protein [Caudoviricetes sp.]